MHAAALAGRTEVVRWLLREGVDANRPCHLPVALAGPALWGVLFVTPLCGARFKRRDATAALLASQGARDDVFTAAFLGDLDELARQLATDRDLAQASDPAADALDITPLHHAVAAQRTAAVELLLQHLPDPVRGRDHALRSAAEGESAESVAIVEQLIARGAVGGGIGAGRWVLHPRIAPLLAGVGASVGSGGAWIGLCCTGNQGRKDDPEYVRALLRHGARVDDRRAGATALHFAAKAGFVGTIAVLLEHGADAEARDGDDQTPADWVERAAKSVDRAAVRRLLRAGA